MTNAKTVLPYAAVKWKFAADAITLGYSSVNNSGFGDIDTGGLWRTNSAYGFELVLKNGALTHVGLAASRPATAEETARFIVSSAQKMQISWPASDDMQKRHAIKQLALWVEAAEKDGSTLDIAPIIETVKAKEGTEDAARKSLRGNPTPFNYHFGSAQVIQGERMLDPETGAALSLDETLERMYPDYSIKATLGKATGAVLGRRAKPDSAERDPFN